ncbi:hydroxyethylthiazole kinase [Exiguobacterium acetylicum]|uniref:hydroxyethylthiazole kinase n=1 Tax=Exiguobacterium acetylicum TaxID=41170 RepID=UPI003977D532
MFTTILEQKPLIHHLTNTVTINDCANVTLAVGASPVMAEDIREVEEMVRLAQALVLNIGTLDADMQEAQRLAAREAERLNVPIILDPVGAGATTLRTEFSKELIDLGCTVIKGNASEIKTLLGENGRTKGVDAAGDEIMDRENIRAFARKQQSVVVVTGPIDYITDGTREIELNVGTPRLGNITGTGCMTASIIASFLGAGYTAFEAAVHGTFVMGKAGERATSAQGLGDFKRELFNAISLMTEQDLMEVTERVN